MQIKSEIVDGQIKLTTIFKGFETMYQDILNLKEELIQDGLKKLGWTPPEYCKNDEVYDIAGNIIDNIMQKCAFGLLGDIEYAKNIIIKAIKELIATKSLIACKSCGWVEGHADGCYYGNLEKDFKTLENNYEKIIEENNSLRKVIDNEIALRKKIENNLKDWVSKIKNILET